MTLGDAVEILAFPIACACAGGRTPRDPRCFCERRIDEARDLVRAAHIAVKLVDDVVQKHRGRPVIDPRLLDLGIVRDPSLNRGDLPL